MRFVYNGCDCMRTRCSCSVPVYLSVRPMKNVVQSSKLILLEVVSNGDFTFISIPVGRNLDGLTLFPMLGAFCMDTRNSR